MHYLMAAVNETVCVGVIEDVGVRMKCNLLKQLGQILSQK